MPHSLLKTLLLVSLVMALPAPVFSAGSEQSLRIATGRSAYTVVIKQLVDGFLELNSDVKVEMLNIGSLRAMELARKGTVDILITYYRAGERRLLNEGIVSNRVGFMFSSYAIFGPPNDELGLVKETTIRNVLKIFEENESAFIISSKRGGTYHKLSELWANAGVKPNWPWYEVTDTTSLGAMRIAAEQGAYVFSDMGTYLLNKDELSSELVPLYQGGYELHKPFSVMLINHKKNQRRNNPYAEKFVDFIISDRGQQIISNINKAKFKAPVFFPAAYFDPSVVAMRTNAKLIQTNRNLYIVSGLLAVTGLLLLFVFYMAMRARNFHKDKLSAEIARGIAEQASTAKSEFLSRMSHELRTPMNAILGFSQILEMQEQDVEKKQNLQEIVTAGQHLHHLIDDVLELSNIENDRIEIAITAVNLNKIVDESVALCQQEIKRYQVSISIEGDFNYSVAVDPTRLKEVLLNLISNAAKYNKPDGIINIRAEKLVGKSRVRLSIRDTGYGISKEKQARLFEPFERLGFESTGIDGTGIGLVISKNLIELMSGRIGFVSAPEQGSTFWIELELA